MERSLTAIKELEKTLETRLGPVHPSQDFVNKLYDKLKNDPGISIEQKPSPVFLIVIGAGLVAGLLVFFFLRRDNSSE